MRKSLLVLAIGMALTGSAFALTVDDLNSPYETDISAGSGGLTVTDAGKVINNSIYIGGPSTSLNEIFKNDGQIITGVLDIFATQTPKFNGSITATEKFIYKGTGADSYDVALNSIVETPLLVIWDEKIKQTGLKVSKQETINGIQAIEVLSQGGKTGLIVNGQDLKLPENIWLRHLGTANDARVELYAGSSAYLTNLYAEGESTKIQLNGSSSAVVENIYVAKGEGSHLNIQSELGGDLDAVNQITLHNITVGEGASIRASVYTDADNYKKDRPDLLIKGDHLNITLEKDAKADFGGYKEDGDHTWRPEDIIFSADSLTVNIADSRSDNKIYFSGVEGNLKTKLTNITLIADASNNTGNVTDDLNQLANIAYTNTK